MVVQVGPDDCPLSMDGKILLKAGQAAVYPLWWTETATSNLQTRFKDIANEIQEVVAGPPRAVLGRHPCEGPAGRQRAG
eukprot:7346527-Alexandrium_andersonii.AAC.1